jgi:hypothetical protein
LLTLVVSSMASVVARASSNRRARSRLAKLNERSCHSPAIVGLAKQLQRLAIGPASLVNVASCANARALDERARMQRCLLLSALGHRAIRGLELMFEISEQSGNAGFFQVETRIIPDGTWQAPSGRQSQRVLGTPRRLCTEASLSVSTWSGCRLRSSR